MTVKTVKCPSCKNTLKATGKPGDIIEVKCEKCNTIGKVTFPKNDVSYENNNIIVIRNLTKRYKRLLALNNVTFGIKKGEVFGYIGPNGAGKTTTLKIIIDLIKKTDGEVFIDGFMMPEKKDQVHKLIGYVPQQPGFQKWRTVDHALKTFGTLSGMNQIDLEKRIVELLETFNLSNFRYAKIQDLSGGMAQKVGLIQALLHKPKILILDEPLSGLDPESRYQIKQIIKKTSKEEGTTVFFSSHILSDVQDVATKIGILNFGNLITVGNLDELKYRFIRENEVEIILSKKGKWQDIKSIKGVVKVEEIDTNKLMAYIDKNVDNDEIVHQIIDTLLKNNCRLRSIAPLQPDLDQLYQRYLGRGGFNL